MQLKELASARSGDKGNHVNIGIVANDAESFLCLQQHLTAEKVADYFSGLQPYKVERYLLPNIDALNFVLYGVLDGGGSVSLRSDAQGKLLGTAILEMQLDDIGNQPPSS